MASYGQDGPKDGITIEQLWIDLDVIFAPVELASDRDKRFAKLKLENFPDISSFVVAYQKAVAECGIQPDESYRLRVLTTAIQDNPNIAFHMQKAVEAQASPNSFHFIGELRMRNINAKENSSSGERG